jgi:tRNA A-37 threonylcarbamoyl transferase component Bud32
MICNISNLKIIGKGVFGIIYDFKNNKIIKKIDINNNISIKNIIKEIKVLIKVKNDPYFVKLYGIKVCNTNNKKYVLIKMEKLDYTLEEWMKYNHSIEEWKSVLKQIFICIDRLNRIYNISNYDLKPDNFMFKNGKLKMIDFGLTFRYIGELNYLPIINLINNKYGIGIYFIVNYLRKKNWSKKKAWKYATNYKLVQTLFDNGTININNICKWEYPDKIIPFIKELKKDIGKPAKYFLDKYFHDIK